MTWIKVPVSFVKEGEPDYKGMGVDIEPDEEIAEMLINLDNVNSATSTPDGQETIVNFYGLVDAVVVKMGFDEFVTLLRDGKEDSK